MREVPARPRYAVDAGTSLSAAGYRRCERACACGLDLDAADPYTSIVTTRHDVRAPTSAIHVGTCLCGVPRPSAAIGPSGVRLMRITASWLSIRGARLGAEIDSHEAAELLMVRMLDERSCALCWLAADSTPVGLPAVAVRVLKVAGSCSGQRPPRHRRNYARPTENFDGGATQLARHLSFLLR